jgi:hypothetical protein
MIRSFSPPSGVFIESPYTADPKSGDLPLSGIFADHHLVAFQISVVIMMWTTGKSSDKKGMPMTVS